MEKRLLLAVTLSFLVLYVWAALNTPRNMRHRPNLANTGVSQPIDNKQVETYDAAPPPTSGDADDKISINNNVESFTGNIESERIISEQLITLSTDKLSIVFTTAGGNIKSIEAKDHGILFPVGKIASVNYKDNVPYVIEYQDSRKISFRFVDGIDNILKTYRLVDNEYVVQASTEISSSLMSKNKNLIFNGMTIDMSSLDSKSSSVASEKALFEYDIKEGTDIIRKASAYKFTNKDERDSSNKIDWIGYRNRYYCLIVAPLYENSGFFTRKVNEHSIDMLIKAKEVAITSDGASVFTSIIYAGPEKADLLKKYNLGFESIKRYYRWGFLDAIAKFIDWFMHLIFKLVPNWGICIILTSIFVYFSMYPLTLRSMASMKRMQMLQPKIAMIKDKYKDNPQKMNQEMMEFYKKEKINPLGGCLPMVLQLPVFIGLYQVLWRSVSFKGADFLWIKDLSEPDRLFILPTQVPFIDNEVNFLPLLMMVIMFFQQKITAKNMVITDPNQLMQQKMMGTIMPVFLGVIFYKFASGLTLYFTMFYIFSTFTQWVSYKSTGVANEKR